jgi:hypothetical protein
VIDLDMDKDLALRAHFECLFSCGDPAILESPSPGMRE